MPPGASRMSDPRATDSLWAEFTQILRRAGAAILDGKIVIAGMPGEALRKRTAAKVPVLIGTASDNLPVLFPRRDSPLSFFGADAPAAQAVYFAGAADPVAAIKKIAVDITMHEPARFVASQVTAAGKPAWLYTFTLRTNAGVSSFSERAPICCIATRSSVRRISR